VRRIVWNQPLLFQPALAVTRFSFSDVLEEMRAAYFPEIEERVEVRMVATSALAAMYPNFMGRDRHMVVFHPVLNHPATPVEVVRFLAKHELAHIVRPPRFIDGELNPHPPSFWEFEHAIGPEYHAVWTWIRHNLGSCLEQRWQGIHVAGRWRRLRTRPRTPYTPMLPFNGEQWDRICPGAGSQLLFPPDWAPRPLPAAGPAPEWEDGRMGERARGADRSSAPKPC
jgi:hypothetical protein